jgi:RNA polymerase sigma-70 factor (ECF subfamily)
MRSPDEAAEDAEFWAVRALCVIKMRVTLAQAFELRELAMESVREICDSAGITSKNLAVRLHRARLMLRQCLEEHWFCHAGNR